MCSLPILSCLPLLLDYVLIVNQIQHREGKEKSDLHIVIFPERRILVELEALRPRYLSRSSANLSIFVQISHPSNRGRDNLRLRMGVGVPRDGAGIRRARHSAYGLRRGGTVVESEPALDGASSLGDKRHLIKR